MINRIIRAIRGFFIRVDKRYQNDQNEIERLCDSRIYHKKSGWSSLERECTSIMTVTPGKSARDEYRKYKYQSGESLSIADLRRELSLAESDQNYEHCAKLRDRINDLKRGLDSGLPEHYKI